MMSETNRRKFLGAAAGAAAFTIIPRHALGGPGYVPPSDKITLAHIGTGTEGLREIFNLLAAPEIRIVAVCDPNRDATGYRDFGRDSLLRDIREALKKPDWRPGGEGAVPGGREVGRNVVDTFYGDQSCKAYADFRELFAKETDIDAVKIMTPDHLHGVIATAAMKRGKHVIVHKPISNRLAEARRVIETARAKGVATHFMPWDSNGSMEQVMTWIRGGEIGTLREVHNWSARPMWPQYALLPRDNPPVPEGFDWDLWLGPEKERPYHPDYTHMVFRGWYDFGGGSMADMGHYSLWTVFNALELAGPTAVEPMLSHQCAMDGPFAYTVRNDYSFPIASVVRFKYPARGSRGPVDLVWYDGGMKPVTPAGVDELEPEGMMFTGDKGVILGGFRVENPRILGKPAPPPPPADRRHHDLGELSPGLKQWVAACRGGAQSPGCFLNAGPITEAVNLYSAALRAGRRIVFDAAAGRITNIDDANRYLVREYRKGWSPEEV
ncbi:MAG: Gfo/Idh/MocA family oxidoreductase [Acidobacteriota bacterium]|nr:Gfo/Idh/MocA family oxidoreductase [Acidobacteriota bacterium]